MVVRSFAVTSVGSTPRRRFFRKKKKKQKLTLYYETLHILYAIRVDISCSAIQPVTVYYFYNDI